MSEPMSSKRLTQIREFLDSVWVPATVFELLDEVDRLRSRERDTNAWAKELADQRDLAADRDGEIEKLQDRIAMVESDRLELSERLRRAGLNEWPS